MLRSSYVIRTHAEHMREIRKKNFRPHFQQYEANVKDKTFFWDETSVFLMKYLDYCNNLSEVRECVWSLVLIEFLDHQNIDATICLKRNIYRKSEDENEINLCFE